MCAFVDRPRRSGCAIHVLVVHELDPHGRANAFLRNCRRLLRQLDDGVVIVIGADQAAEPVEVAQKAGPSECDLRQHGDPL